MTGECVFTGIAIGNTPVQPGPLIIRLTSDKAELLNVQLLLSGHRRRIRVRFHVNLVHFRT